MSDFSAERSLLVLLLLNAAVFGSAYFFARRRMQATGSQAALDAALLGYLVQYCAVGIPGLCGLLHPLVISVTALVLCAGLFVAGVSRGHSDRAPARAISRATPWQPTIALFAIAFVLADAYKKSYLPVISNDALTYHFPAAAQWLQQGRIGLFQTWFFNPANTYSPLAGSIFITWLIVPFGTDVLARFVEVPALLCMGLACYRLCIQVSATEPCRAGPVSAARGRSDPDCRLRCALIATAAVLARPIFQPGTMGKDDLFVVFFFIAAVVALLDHRSAWGGLRFGIALGLLLATKYTAILSAPILLLALGRTSETPDAGSEVLARAGSASEESGPSEYLRTGLGGAQRVFKLSCGAGPIRWWISALVTAVLLAGPWYLRNWILTANPLFPLRIDHLFRGLFTTSRSRSFDSFQSAAKAVVGGQYGLPIALVAVLGLGWLVCVLTAWRRIWREPVLRLCVIGPPGGLTIFFVCSPFPEVRFLLAVFVLLFACQALAIGRICRQRLMANGIAGLIAAASLLTLFDPTFWRVAAAFAGASLVVAAIGAAAAWWAGRHWQRWAIIVATCSLLAGAEVYVNWTAYSRDYAGESAYAREYPPGLDQLWRFVRENTPADATVAYTNIYLIYPMQGRLLGRRFVYAPTRAGVFTIADLPWLGSNLSGEQLIPAAARATVAFPDRKVWLENLKESGAQYLVIGRGGVVGDPPEARFVSATGELMFAGDGGLVYRLRDLRMTNDEIRMTNQ